MIWGGSKKVALLDANGGFGGVKKCVVEIDANGILRVDWDVVCTKD